MARIRPLHDVARGLWHRITGKTEKALGAAAGNPRLIASGEIHEAEADARMDSAEAKVVADRLRDEATDLLERADNDLEHERAETDLAEARATSAVERHRQERIADVDNRGRSRIEASGRQAHAELRGAQRQEQVARRDHRSARRKADARRTEARKKRREAEAIDEAERST